MVKNLSKYFICPVCGEKKPWGNMVKHAAYSGDSKHEKWRTSHGFPAKNRFWDS